MWASAADNYWNDHIEEFNTIVRDWGAEKTLDDKKDDEY
jgi:hypothetical protein